MELNDILKIAFSYKASDIHLKAGLPPIFRIDGSLVPLKKGDMKLSPEKISEIAWSICSPRQKEKFLENNEIDLAYGIAGLGRFRVNIFQQRGTIGIVLRTIPMQIMNFDQLFLPPVLKKISSEKRGLVLVTGTTGSGKSTTLSAIIDYINSTRTEHIMTIEDPIEYLHRDKKSIINQREIGFDTNSFAVALKSALRQDPDVILVGEMRDFETIETALLAAETGHLVLSTLHTVDATETVNRIVSVFPPYHQKQVRIQLSSILKAVISQRLVQREDTKGRVPACEVMVTTARMKECITEKDKTKEIHEAIAQGHVTYGMQTFDQALMLLLRKKFISYETALRQSSNPDDFALKMQGVSSTSDSWTEFESVHKDEKEEEEVEGKEDFKIDRF
jgi:twitching motility protein PilT